MNFESLNKIAYKAMGDRKAHLGREIGFIYYHGQRVSKIVIQLRKEILKNDDSYDDLLMVAAMFHDIAKGIEPHAKHGVLLIKELLKNELNNDEIEKVSELIYHHPDRKKGHFSDYIKLLQDADMIDHFGSIEIWMNFHFQSNNNNTIHDSVNFYENEFDKLIEKNRKLLNYDLSLKIYDDKIKFIKDFAKRFKSEANGEIYNLNILKNI